jgi:hypothetical protein
MPDMDMALYNRANRLTIRGTVLGAMERVRMRRLLLVLTLTSLLLVGCASTPHPDVESTVHVAVAATLTAQPSETPTRMLTREPTPISISTPTFDVKSTVQVAVAATLTAQPTKTPTCTPTRELTPTVRPLSTKAPPSLAFSLETYRAQGFSFQYPVNARLESVTPAGMAWQAVSPATTQIHVSGPEIWIKPGDADWSYRGPAYRLIIRTYENPEALDAEAWARNYILTSWQEARRLKRPWGALPVSEQGEIDEDKVGSSMIAGQPTFWVNYFGFDKNIIACYLVSGHQVVEVMFFSYPLENLPIAAVQRDVYALILDTFRLTGQ